MLELVTNSTSASTSIDLNLVGTWALVIAATLTLIIATVYNHKTIKQSMAQTNLQQKQFAEILKEQERPRIVERLQKVLTPAIELIEKNNTELMGSFLNRDNLQIANIFTASDKVAKLAFESFKSKYPDLANRIRAYDGLPSGIREKKTELRNILVVKVSEVQSSMMKEYNEATMPGAKPILSTGDLDAEQIVVRGIFPTLQGKTIQVRSTLEVFWIFGRDRFVEFANQTRPREVMTELRQLAQQSFDVGNELSKELAKLREQLGVDYRIPIAEFFSST